MVLQWRGLVVPRLQRPSVPLCDLTGTPKSAHPCAVLGYARPCAQTPRELANRPRRSLYRSLREVWFGCAGLDLVELVVDMVGFVRCFDAVVPSLPRSSVPLCDLTGTPKSAHPCAVLGCARPCAQTPRELANRPQRSLYRGCGWSGLFFRVA